jgi:hypothetical protein
MKIKDKSLLIAFAMLAALNLQFATAQAQGTAFTYQGRLNNGSALANGSYDVTFTLFNANASGVVIAGPMTNSATVVSNGLFTTTVDFGAGVFTGSSNWLEIAVRTNGSGAFATLSPRQQLTPTPYALYAPNAGAALTAGNASVAGSAVVAASANSVAAANISGTILNASLPTNPYFSGTVTACAFSGDGAGLTNLDIRGLRQFSGVAVPLG